MEKKQIESTFRTTIITSARRVYAVASCPMQHTATPLPRPVTYTYTRARIYPHTGIRVGGAVLQLLLVFACIRVSRIRAQILPDDTAPRLERDVGGHFG